MKASELRKKFLDFFSANGHTIFPSASLIPERDPTLLFTNAGMNQFKNFFLGVAEPKYDPVATCQKCLRISGKHNDLENIGFTRRHHTFFEMLGNFSFGKYFKDEAIHFAWNFITKELGISPSKVVVTYFKEDKQTADLWRKIAGLDPSRIIPMGEEDNFWSMGDVGPCGPCTEIHVFLADHDPVNIYLPQNSSLFLEIWNLVFMEFNKKDTVLEPLPRKCVDTGMGLERLASVIQNVESNFSTDLFQQIIKSIEQVSGKMYRDEDYDGQMTSNVAFRVIADHARAISFLISEGVIPGNEERSYVLRKLIRRACLFARRLTDYENSKIIQILESACVSACDSLYDVYPELGLHKSSVMSVLRAEALRFLDILEEGLNYIDKMIKSNEKFISGDIAFTLHDTFGFPIELTKDVAKEKGLKVDEAGFEKLMRKQKETSRSEKKFFLGSKSNLSSEFVGYEQLECVAKIVEIENIDNDTLGIVTDVTCFYPESGGQIGDTGTITILDKVFQIFDTQKLGSGGIVHLIKKDTNFKPSVGTEVFLKVDKVHRDACSRAHSATHVLHYALRETLGKEIRQAGSKVGEDWLHFDFTFLGDLTNDKIISVQNLVDDFCRKAFKAEIFYTTLDEAKSMGALAFFGEKYDPHKVRIVKFGSSVELCGGTHVENISQVLPIIISKVFSVSSGVKRLEAVVGPKVVRFYLQQTNEISEALGLAKSQSSIRETVKRLINEIKDLNHTIGKLKNDLASVLVHSSPHILVDLGKFIVCNLESKYFDIMESTFDTLKAKYEKGIVVFCSKNEKNHLIIGGSHNLESSLIKEIFNNLDGRGGGSENFYRGYIKKGLSDLLNFLSKV